MLEIPGFINLVFILTALVTYLFFVMANLFSPHVKVQQGSKTIALLLLLWIIFQSTLSLNRWYMDRLSMPPNMAFPIITWLVIISALFFVPRFKNWLNQVNLNLLTWIHIVRIPVEMCLYWLALQKQLPWSMTFNGYNFDIIFGFTAPIMALLYFTFKKIPARVMLIWNVLGLISVLAVVARGIGAVPSPIQSWDFSQPNYAVMHFPFIWLPSFIVPVVVLSHLIAIRRFRNQA
jgi:hypothetical protein